MVRTLDVFGVPHAYELTAPTDASTVLVFIHGWLLSRAYWQPVIQQLSQEYQCLSYDLRGFGESQRSRGSTPIRQSSAFAESTPVESVASSSTAVMSASTEGAIATYPVETYTPADYARDLGVLLRQLNITNAWLVGHSLGGNIALWAADQLPDVVKGVICVNSGGGIYLKEEFERFRSAGQQLLKLRPRWLCYLPLVDLMMSWMNVAHPLARSWGRKRLVDLVNADPQAALGTLLDSTTETEVHRLPQVVSRLQQPVHFIAGCEDTVMAPQYVLHLASFHHLFQYCGDNVSQIPNCGHLAMVEQPSAVIDEIKTVLQKY